MFGVYFLQAQWFYEKTIRPKISWTFLEILLMFLFRIWTDSWKVMATLILVFLPNFYQISFTTRVTETLSDAVF